MDTPSGAFSKQPMSISPLRRMTSALSPLRGSCMQKIDSGNASDLVVVDSRTEAEYVRGHIPGAIHIPFKAAADEEFLRRLPKGKLIVLVCKSGHTSSMVNAIFNMLGYQAVTLKEGMKGWTGKLDQ